MSNFFENFKNQSFQDWQKKTESEFISQEYNNLYSEYEDIKISPYYQHSNNNIVLGFPDEIKNLQLIDATNPKTANKKALNALNAGIDGISFSNPSNLKVLLKEIKTEYIKLDFINVNDAFIHELKNYDDLNKIVGGIQTSSETKFNLSLIHI